MSTAKALKKNLLIEQREDWVCGPFRLRDATTKLPLDFSAYTGTDLQLQIREDVADNEATILADLNLGNGGIVLVPTLTAALALDTAFTASTTLVVAAATFRTDGVLPGDLVTIAGSTSNDGARRVVTVTSETTLVLDGADFTAEAAAGTVTVTNESRFQLVIVGGDGAASDLLDFEGDEAVYDLYTLIAGLLTRVMEGKVKLSRTVTRN